MSEIEIHSCMINALTQALGPNGTLVMPTMTDGEDRIRSAVDANAGHGDHARGLLVSERRIAQITWLRKVGSHVVAVI